MPGGVTLCFGTATVDAYNSRLALWALIVFGLTTIITQSKLFGPARRLYQRMTGSTFLQCPMCIGFWAGVGLALVRVTPIDSTPWGALLSGCASSAVCWVGYVILVRLGAKDL